MECEYCGYTFVNGEYLTRVYVYWTTNEWGPDTYEDGVKPTGWAHLACSP